MFREVYKEYYAMKGIVFTEMIENEFGLSMLDEIIETSDLPSKGIYTSVGTYSHHEMVILLVRFSELTKIPIPEALRMFVYRLFHCFFNQYPHLEWLAVGLLEGAFKQFDVIGDVKIVDSSDPLKSCLIQIKLL
jgi:hypothetical protein